MAKKKEKTPKKVFKKKISLSPEAIAKRNKIIREALAVILGLLGIFILICIFAPKSTGFIGESVNYAFNFWFGWSSYLMPFMVLYMGIGIIFWRKTIKPQWLILLITLLFFDLTIFVYLLKNDGGLIGKIAGGWLLKAAGIIGAYLFTIGFGVILFMILTRTSLKKVFELILPFIKKIGKAIKKVFSFSNLSNLNPKKKKPEDIPEAATLEEKPKPQIIFQDFDEDKKDINNESITNIDNNEDNEIKNNINTSYNEVKDTISNSLLNNCQEEEDTEEMNISPPISPIMKSSPKKQKDINLPTLVEGTPDGKPQGYDLIHSEEKDIDEHQGKKYRYEFPPISLLKGIEKKDEEKSASDYSRLLEETLANFGVEVKVINKIRGPAVTRYELQPAKGVKVKKVTNLANDIALSLAAYSIRIEAPIPGKSAIGIEVPNHRIDPVSLREILIMGKYKKQPKVTLALGKDITGRSVMDNLLKMPHILIAGATGSGKSVCINCLIVSMLYNTTPYDIQMIMVDPKRVELSMFEGIPHLIDIKLPGGKKIITDPKAATLALKSVCDIMDQRYEDFVELKVRNIKEYNKKSDTPIPYVVVVIDELADLMMVSSSTVEQYICRIAQLGRASGIHLIVATQRPSVDVITGLIKANIPSRIAFAVSSQVDSRTILDRTGAEKLLGKGDMLYQPVDAMEPRRIQGAYVSSEETEKIVEFWKTQPIPETSIPIEIKGDLDKRGKFVEAEGESNSKNNDDKDPLINDAIEIIRTTQQASVSNLQRKMKIGYARAGRIMDQLEQMGYVGPADGSKPRKIFLPGL